MLLKRRLGVLAAVVAALAVGAPVAKVSAATIPGQWIVPSSCAVTNPATGCAPYLAIHGGPASTARSSAARSGRLRDGHSDRVQARGLGARTSY